MEPIGLVGIESKENTLKSIYSILYYISDRTIIIDKITSLLNSQGFSENIISEGIEELLNADYVLLMHSLSLIHEEGFNCLPPENNQREIYNKPPPLLRRFILDKREKIAQFRPYLHR